MASEIQMEKLLANKRVLQALWTYNEYLNQVYQLDQQFSYEENPLRNFLHTKTPGDPESTQHFFTDLAAYADQIDAKMREEDWDFDLVYDPERSEVAYALGIAQTDRKKKKLATPAEAKDENPINLLGAPSLAPANRPSCTKKAKNTPM